MSVVVEYMRRLILELEGNPDDGDSVRASPIASASSNQTTISKPQSSDGRVSSGASNTSSSNQTKSAVKSFDDVTAFLEENGLAQFSEPFRRVGVKNIKDLFDLQIVTDELLSTSISMSPVQVMLNVGES